MADYKILIPPPPRRRPVWIVGIAVVVVLAAGAGTFVVVRHDHHSGRRATDRGTRPPPPPALRVLSTTPANGATDVPADQVVTVTLSSAVTGVTGMPGFVPPVAGTWAKIGPRALTFVATAPFIPTTPETLTIPAGSSGPHGAHHTTLAAPVTLSFIVAQASTERLQQLLAQLDYLPLSFTPTGPLGSPIEATKAQPGTFAWRWPNTPASLTSLWVEGAENVITKAAVMNFENQNGLAVDGVAGKEVWAALLADGATDKVNAAPYTYVVVSKQLPENLTVFSDGAPVLSDIPVNTGAPGADTTDGTYPVFEHVTSSRMEGTNPDGSTYDDPAVPWASFFNGGDALHGFVRATYGTPQSNGCVEMALPNAAKVWPLSPIGTLVTVVGPPS